MKRADEKLLRSHLEGFPCVALIGVRQCGKTTMLGTLPAGWSRYDLERRADYQVVSRDPDTFFRLNPRHIAIDEAQLLPGIYSALRVAIDERRSERGRFVITGSSSPDLLRPVSESLAGRVAVIEMAPWAAVYPFVNKRRKTSRYCLKSRRCRIAPDLSIHFDRGRRTPALEVLSP